MPHFRFRAISPEQTQQLSKPLVDALQEQMGCARGDFTIEHIPTTFFSEGEPAAAWPFIEIFCFDRGQVVQDEIAARVTSLVREVMNVPEQDVAVVFIHFRPENYYDNGVHY